MTKVLLTGFEAFGKDSINPSLEAVKRIGEKSFTEIEIIVQQIPVVFHKALTILAEIMDKKKPDVVICVGQAGGRSAITMERIAINVDDARIPDNEGNQPIDLAIVPTGPDGYFTTLPIKAIVQNIRANGIPASISHTAGTYVCNHLFYGLCHLIATKYPSTRGGFIHIPFLPEQAVKRKMQPSMNLEDIVKGLEIAILTSVEHEKDIVVVGGEIC